MEDYKPNSHRSKEKAAAAAKTEKKVEKVVNGTVKTKKKSEMNKLKDLFISEDAANVKSYILMDVLVPAVKKAISDIVTDGVSMILFGTTGNRSSRGNSSFIPYDKFSRREDDRRYGSARTRSGYSFDDIYLESRGEAEEVLSRMDELIDMYGVVSVADLYDLVGITGNYTDNKYGWTNIRNAEPVRAMGGGYMLKLPKALPIN